MNELQISYMLFDLSVRCMHRIAPKSLRYLSLVTIILVDDHFDVSSQKLRHIT